jgi:NADPH-dependent curcumin reductase CurA
MSPISPTASNRKILFARWPHGMPVPDDFKTVTEPVPSPGAGQILLRTLYLSLDPYMRGRMINAPSYVPPMALGDTMCGQVVGRVVESKDAGFGAGDLVLANTGWQDYAVAPAAELTKLDPPMSHPSYALGVLGMPGFTAYAALLDIGQPKAGETVVVTAATGAVGSVAGQIAKIKGCRVVGIAGGAEKCNYAVGTLGYDACVDHQLDDLHGRLAAACPKGIDVYFESVAGACLDAAGPLLNLHARVPLIGFSAYYNLTSLPEGGNQVPVLLRQILVNRITVKGFIFFDYYAARSADFMRDMSAWLGAGKIKYREDVLDGLQKAPEGLIGMLRGDNFGKLIVKVADE